MQPVIDTECSLQCSPSLHQSDVEMIDKRIAALKESIRKEKNFLV